MQQGPFAPDPYNQNPYPQQPLRLNGEPTQPIAPPQPPPIPGHGPIQPQDPFMPQLQVKRTRRNAEKGNREFRNEGTTVAAIVIDSLGTIAGIAFGVFMGLLQRADLPIMIACIIGGGLLGLAIAHAIVSFFSDPLGAMLEGCGCCLGAAVFMIIGTGSLLSLLVYAGLQIFS